jgi:hypothetical protein
MYPDAAIRFRTEIPDYSHLDHKTYDWAYSVYGESNEEVPTDMPTPRGKPVRTSTFEDANLMHDLTTGRSVTGILHLLVNSTPADWLCKLQGRVSKPPHMKWNSLLLAWLPNKSWTYATHFTVSELLLMEKLIRLAIMKASLQVQPFHIHH